MVMHVPCLSLSSLQFHTHIYTNILPTSSHTYVKMLGTAHDSHVTSGSSRVIDHSPEEDPSGAVEDGASLIRQLVLQSYLEPHTPTQPLSPLLCHSLGHWRHTHTAIVFQKRLHVVKMV